MHLIRISALSMVLFALILIVFMHQPASDPLPIFALSADTCHLPCWFGIEPGKTTRGEMEARLAQSPDLFSGIQYINIFPSGFTQCWLVKPYAWRVCIGEGRDPKQLISFLQFLPPRGTVSLGDMIRYFGRPTYTFGCLAHATPIASNPFSGMNVQFGGMMLVTAYNAAQNGQALTPQMNVQTITLGLGTPDAQPAMMGLPKDQIWRGFGMRSVYPARCSFP
ncbi:MAG: hypothetical protein KF716_03420 [Anaerolineae bacterium]|nr:hypothetical protein [Anaerolineae bacterium]